MIDNRNEEGSLFDFASTVLQHRWSVVRWMLAGGALAILPVITQGLTYTAIASFMPQGQTTDNSTSGLRSLAGQFGLAVGGGGSTQSPQFYADLLKSSVILSPILVDSFVVVETSQRGQLADLLGAKGPTPEARLENGAERLGVMVGTRVNRETSVLTLGVTTRWPSLSAAIADKIMSGIDSFSLRHSQGQAGDERRFTEARLGEAQKRLRDAEDKLQAFLQANRSLESSTELRFARDRLQRAVDLQQQIVISLSQSYEEARIKEVRASPSIMVIQRPSPPTLANPRGRVKRGLLGVLLGAFFGVVLALARKALRSRRDAGDPHVERFFNMLSDARGDFARLLGKGQREPGR